MTEREMERAIRDAVGKGGFVFHIRDSRGAPEMADFPDLVVILPAKRCVLFLELKSQTRRVTDGQRAVLDALDACRQVESFVVRPSPLPMEISYARLMNWLSDEAS